MSFILDTAALEKLPLDLLPFDALEEIARVLEFGAKKHGRRDWERGLSWSGLAAKILRHLFAWMRGADRDDESGRLHLAHAACCLLFLLSHHIRQIGTDDR